MKILCYIQRFLNIFTCVSNCTAPVYLLILRCWLWIDFAYYAGINKLNDWSSTLYLFEHEFNTTWLPLPPPVVEMFDLTIPKMPVAFAAYSGTFVEIFIPSLVLVGIGGRVPAIIFFIFNYVAVCSYPSLWQDGWEAAFNQHITWGSMIATVVFFGHGKLSIDKLLSKKCNKCNY